MSMLDGFEELPKELQVEIEKAFEQGHVDDADWKGVSFLSLSSISCVEVEFACPGFRLTRE